MLLSIWTIALTQLLAAAAASRIIAPAPLGPHDDAPVDVATEFADTSLLQGSTALSGPAPQDGNRAMLAVDGLTLFDGPPLVTDAPGQFVYSEVKRSMYILCILCTCYSLYCICYELQPQKSEEEDKRESTAAETYTVPPFASSSSARSSMTPECRRRDPLLDCHVIRFVTTFIMVGRHLADALDYKDPLGQELHSWGNAFVIPAFSFASGVFNASVDSSTVYTVWSCAALAVLLSLITHVLVALALSVGPVSGAMVFVHRIRYYWYLPCLFLWRLTILPLASYAQSLKVPLIVVFTAIFGFCYGGRHFWMATYNPSTLVFVWNRLFAFGPFFAAGALLPRQGWLRLITDIRLQVLGAVYFSVWHLLLITLPVFRQWNVTVCFEPSNCEFHELGGHFPMAALYRPYSLAGVVVDLAIYASMLPVTFAVIWLVGGAVAFAAPRVPSLVSFCASCGANTLFALVLHVPIVEVAKLTQVRFLADDVPEWIRIPLLVFLTVHTVAVLTCSATVSLLRTLVAPCLPVLGLRAAA